MRNAKVIEVKTIDGIDDEYEQSAVETKAECASLSNISQRSASQGSVVNRDIELANDLRIVRSVPGSSSGLCLNLWSMKRKGHLLYLEKMRRHKSSVFRMKNIDDRIILCDWYAIRILFDASKVVKERGFGSLEYNPVLLNQYTPSIFSAGDEHARKKEFVIEFLKTINYKDSIKDVVSIAVNEILSWSMTGEEQKSVLFEPFLERLCGKIVTTLLLGKPLSDLSVLEAWLEKSLEFEYGVDLTDADEVKIANKVKQDVSSTPAIEKINGLASKMQLDANSMLKEIVFATIFNAYGGLKHAIISCLVLTLTSPAELRTLLMTEALEFLRSEHTWKDVCKMKNVTYFVYEVLRLHPPAPFVFGRATESLVLQSKSGYFQIKEGDLLCGNVYLAQRDPDLFPCPDQVDLKRYKDTSCLQYILSFGGCFGDESRPANRFCPGQNLSLALLNVVTAVFLNCDVSPTSSLEWTGKHMRRLCAPDKPLEVKKFHYRSLHKT